MTPPAHQPENQGAGLPQRGKKLGVNLTIGGEAVGALVGADSIISPGAHHTIQRASIVTFASETALHLEHDRTRVRAVAAVVQLLIGAIVWVPAVITISAIVRLIVGMARIVGIARIIRVIVRIGPV